MRRLQNKKTKNLKLKIQTILFVIAFVFGGLICIYQYIFPFNNNDNPSQTRRRLESADDENAESLSAFPPLIFTLEQLGEWAWFLYLLGMFYCFIGIAIVCDSYFVPAIEVIVDKLNMSDDTAAATWLAAGGSAPEFATSVIGTFIAKSDVGFGTIVGSAVFNILFIIGVCSMFTAGKLKLHWYSFARDMSYYLSCLGLLGVFFALSTPGQIYWFESAILFCLYLCYVFMMKNNARIKLWVFKKFISTKLKNSKNTLLESKNIFDYYGSAELISYSLTDKVDSKSDKKDGKIKKNQSFIADLATIQPKVLFKHNYKMDHMDNASDTGTAFSSTLLHEPTITLPDGAPLAIIPPVAVPPEPAKSVADSQHSHHSYTVHTVKTIETEHSHHSHSHHSHHSNHSNHSAIRTHRTRRGGMKSQLTAHGTVYSVYSYVSRKGKAFDFELNEEHQDEEGDVNKPVNLSFPDKNIDRIWYLIRAPLTFILWLTLFDVKKKKYSNYWPATFFVAVLWLGSLTYLMVWWCVCVGYAWHIPQEIMGLVFLAGGTSLPELLSCIIVIKKGKADMAMSASIGSNIFDILFNLPVPWFVYALAVSNDKHIAVAAGGLFISILGLFVMMGSVFALILINKWVLTHCMGATMIILYFVFIAQDLVRFYFLDI